MIAARKNTLGIGSTPQTIERKHFEGLGGVGAGVDGDDGIVLAGGETADAERAHHHRQRGDERLQPSGDDQARR